MQLSTLFFVLTRAKKILSYSTGLFFRDGERDVFIDWITPSKVIHTALDDSCCACHLIPTERGEPVADTYMYTDEGRRRP